MSSPKPSMILELWHDQWREDFRPEYFVEVARVLDTEINRPEVRKWIEAGPIHPDQYTKLRHLLMVLRKSAVAKSRRLTWLERITGSLRVCNEASRPGAVLRKESVSYTYTYRAEPKRHYYALAFAFGESRTSVYVGYDDASITLPKIREAKKTAGVHDASVLLSCCYLGHMTKAEMKGGDS